MVFVSTIEALDDLLEVTIEFGFFVEVFQSDDPSMVDGVLRVSLGIDEVQPGRISGIAVGDKGDLLLGVGGTDCFGHGHGCGQGVARMGEVISGNLVILRGDEEESIGVLAGDFDVSFIAAAFIVDIAFESQVEVVTIGRGGFGIVEYSLIGNRDSKDLC